MNFRRLAVVGCAALALMFVMGCARTNTPENATSEPTVNKQFELAISVPKGTETELVPDGMRSATDVWIEMIRGAQHTIDLGQFYLTSQHDTAFALVLDELSKAVGRGVRIRLLADKMMWEKTAQDDLGGRAILVPIAKVRLIDFGKVHAGAVHHAKYMIVDGREAFVGSQNFDWRSLEQIHELGLKITDPTIVNAIRIVFGYDWMTQMGIEAGEPMTTHTHTRPPSYPSDGPANPPTSTAWLFTSPYDFTPSDVAENPEACLMKTIQSASKTVDIQVMEYAPVNRDGTMYRMIDTMVRRAVLRGVKVRLMVSISHAKGPALANLKDLSYLGAEVRVVTFPNPDNIPHARVIHSKYMVVDGQRLWLGTSNWSGGYLDKSRNLEVMVRDTGLAVKALSVFNMLWGSPYAEPIALLPAGIPK